MKNKKLTYFLLLVVVSLWGYLLYTVFGAVNNNKDHTLPTPTVQQKIEDLNYYKMKSQDSLALNYRDPLYAPQEATQPSAQTEMTATSSPAPTSTYMPPALPPETPIVYAGFIENEEKKKRVAIVKIANKQYMIATGETQEGVTVQEVQHTYIRIQHKGKTKTIYQ